MLVSSRQSTGLVKATLSIYSPAAGGSPLGGGAETLSFHFNPKEYTVGKTAKWDRTDNKAAPAAGPVQWGGARPRTISGLQIYLDKSDSDSSNVIQETELLLKCCAPTADSLSQSKPTGPFVVFSWGNTTGFAAIVTSVSVKYMMFRPNGEPYRALATLNLEEVGESVTGQNPTSGGLAARRTHTLVAGEDLALIAHSEYGSPTHWRTLALANGIVDPMRVHSGDRLLVPPRDEVSAGA